MCVRKDTEAVCAWTARARNKWEGRGFILVEQHEARRGVGAEDIPGGMSYIKSVGERGAMRLMERLRTASLREVGERLSEVGEQLFIWLLRIGSGGRFMVSGERQR